MNKITKTKRNLVLIFLCAVMVAMAVCPVSAKNNSGVIDTKSSGSNKYSYMKISDDYQEVASSGNLTLSADFNSGLIALKNNENGYVWYGVPTNTDRDSFSQGETKRLSNSQLVLGYINSSSEADAARATYLDSYSASGIEVTEIDNGIQVLYTFDIDLSTNVTNKDGDSSGDASSDASSDSADNTSSDDTSSAGDEAVITDGETDIQKVVQASIPVKYYLSDGHFIAETDVTQIKHTGDIKVVDITLLPYFGAGSWTDNGYMFVPDGSGALIDFNSKNGNETEYSQMVYGRDLSMYEDIESKKNETVRMPVFGIVNGGDNALFGVVSEGAAATSIEAASANENRGYNTAYARFNIKLISQTIMFGKSSNSQLIYRTSEDSDDVKKFKVDYYVLNGDKANYVGMAETYRDYLLSNEKLMKRESTPTLNVDVIGAIDVKANFLGFTYNKLHSLTTYEQTKEMLESLKKAGVDDISVRYLGWGNRGITNGKAINKASPLGLLGGSKKFEELKRYASENNVGFYPDNDLLSYTSGNNKLASKTVFSAPYYKYQYLRSVYAYDLNGIAKRMIIPTKVSGLSDKFIKSYKKLDVSGVSLSTLTNTVYSHLKRNESVYRTKMPSIVSGILENANKNELNVLGDAANDYTFKYLSKITNAPTYSSGYNCFSSEIPFYEIVLHGYMPMAGSAMAQSVDSQTNFLKCVEAGIELNWTGIYEESAQLSQTNYDNYYGSTYTLWIDDAAEKYKNYQPLLKAISSKAIVGHSEISKDVTMTTYENGYKVFVNYTNSDVVYQGVKIPAKSFAYKEG